MELRRAQPPQALTMLPQMSNGLSDYQGNRRLIRALLPETVGRDRRLQMTGPPRPAHSPRHEVA